MHAPFFPGVVFGWCFVSTLGALLALAAVIDLRRMVVPKWLTLTALPLGLLFNVLRGTWLGSLDGAGVLAGAGEGLLFSLAGFAVGFSLFFLLWLLRICGGGDVKLYAALGAWVGAYLAFLVLVLLLFVIAAFTFVLLCGKLLSGRSLAPPRPQARAVPLPTGLLPSRKPRRLLTFSLPLLLATLVVLLWHFRVDLRLAERSVVTTVQVHSHGK